MVLAEVFEKESNKWVSISSLTLCLRVQVHHWRLEVHVWTGHSSETDSWTLETLLCPPPPPHKHSSSDLNSVWEKQEHWLWAQSTSLFKSQTQEVTHTHTHTHTHTVILRFLSSTVHREKTDSHTLTVKSFKCCINTHPASAFTSPPSALISSHKMESEQTD